MTKINSFVKNRIEIKSAPQKENIVAWNNGSTIYVNSNVFYKKSKTEQMKYLLHEFIHLLQNKRNFMVSKTFPEIHKLGEDLYEIVSKNLVGSMAEFLTGRNQNLPTKDEYEILAYLMNGKVDFDALNNKGKKEFVNELYNCGLFNIKSPFWQKRLP
jgi:predicted metal-dependent peptidase